MSLSVTDQSKKFLDWVRALWTVPPPDGVNQPPYWALAQGFVASILMAIGSIGVGWLTPASRLQQEPLFIAMRTTDAGVTWSILLLSFGAMLMVRSWIRLGQRLRYWGQGTLKPVVWSLVLWSLPLFFSIPIYSRDVYAYYAQGRQMAVDSNPYTTGVSTLSNYTLLGIDPQWANSRTPYGPYWLWLERWVVEITGGNVEASVLGFRLLAVIGLAISVYYTYKVAELHGVDGARAVWIAISNPLSIISFVASAHNDSLMIGFALAAVYYTIKGKWYFGIFFTALSIGIKPITIIIMPFIGLLWAGANSGWGRKILCWLGTGIGVLGIFALSAPVYNLGWGWLNAILDATGGYVDYSPSGFLGNIIARMGDAVGLPGGDIAEVFRSGVKYLGVIIAGALIFFGDKRKVVLRLGLAFAAIVMLSPIIHPWYVLWFIPFLAVTGIRDDWQFKTWLVVVVFFMVYGAQDQLSVWPFVSPWMEPRVLALVVTVAFIGYLLLIDPKTRRVLVHFQASGGSGAPVETATPGGSVVGESSGLSDSSTK